jgi:hypothetical protein
LQIGKNSGFSLQKRAVKVKEMDLIRRIKIGWLRSNAGVGWRLTGGVKRDLGR